MERVDTHCEHIVMAEPEVLGDDEVTGGDAARILGVSRQYITRIAHAGVLPARQIAGRYWIFKRADVEAYRLRPKSKGGRPKRQAPPREDDTDGSA